jgi:hypothetical protein
MRSYFPCGHRHSRCTLYYGKDLNDKPFTLACPSYRRINSLYGVFYTSHNYPPTPLHVQFCQVANEHDRDNLSRAPRTQFVCHDQLVPSHQLV